MMMVGSSEEEKEEEEEEVSVGWTPVALIATQIFYFAVFHSLSNLPLSDRLLFGVHQRFWMVGITLTTASINYLYPNYCIHQLSIP